MNYPNRFIISFLVLIHLFGLTLAATPLKYFCVNDTGFYTQNSTYQANLKAMLSSLSSNVSENGYKSGHVGENSERVNAYVMCRGDIQLDTCRACINNSTQDIEEICPNNKEAIIWYDDCMLRYSNNTIAGILNTDLVFFMWSMQNVTNVTQFNEVLYPFMASQREIVASGTVKKFATGNRTVPGAETIYLLQQCTPDLSADDCRICLNRGSKDIAVNFNGRIGGRVIGPSCNYRYEISPFFVDTPSTTGQTPSNEGGNEPNSQAGEPPPGTSPREEGRNNSTTTIIFVLVASVFGILILVTAVCFILKKRNKKEQRHAIVDDVDSSEDISYVESLQYDFDTVKAATNNFSDENKLGQGGFGSVYKGELPNGEEIAVKRLDKNSKQGDLEFKTEVELVAKLQHRNLVKLLGFSLKGNERLLIYEFMPNASLDHLMLDPVKRAWLDWDKRFKIIGGVAKGLLYLHEDSRLRIIHRDLKASNVLLDNEMNPKISDFGMARLFEFDETQANTSRIVGTYGYMAPEYALYGQFSPKSDVFSFGVLVLEIVNGEKNIRFRSGGDADDLPSIAWKNWRDGTLTNVIDPILRSSSGSTRDIIRCIHIGLLCVQEHVNDRPTMSSVLLMLNSLSLTLPVPTEPAFLMHTFMGSDTSRRDQEQRSRTIETNMLSQSKSDRGSVNETSITELYPR